MIFDGPHDFNVRISDTITVQAENEAEARKKAEGVFKKRIEDGSIVYEFQDTTEFE